MKLPKYGTNQLPKAGFYWIALKVIFQCRNGLNLPLFSNFDTHCAFIEVILVLFSNFNCVDFKGYFQGQKGPIWTFVFYLGQYLRNGACCDQFLYEAHIQSHIWSFRWPCDLWPWITFKSQIKDTDLSSGCVS